MIVFIILIFRPSVIVPNPKNVTKSKDDIKTLNEDENKVLQIKYTEQDLDSFTEGIDIDN